MLANHSSSHLPDNISKRDIGIPDAVIAGFLGLGLGYSEWPAEVKKRGYEWSPGLEKVIIERELEYFRPEIQLLMSEETIKVHPSGVRSNSLNTILKRLKGEPWMGRPAEREERLRAHRLLGKDAKPRCLQNYVKRWDEETTSSKCSPFAKGVTATPCTGTSLGEPSRNAPLAFDSTISGSPNMWSSSDSFEPGPSFTQGNGSDADTLSSVFECAPDLEPSLSRLSTQPNTHSMAATNLDSLRQAPAFNHTEGTYPFSDYLIGEDDVPISTNHSQCLSAPESDPNVLNWMATNIVSETLLESPDPATRGPGIGIPGAFLDARRSIEIDMNSFFATDDPDTLEDESATKVPRIAFDGQHESHSGLLEGSSRSVLSPRSTSASRKRRRRSTPDLTTDRPNYGHGSINHIVTDGDTVMYGSDRSLQPTNYPVSQRSWTQLPPPPEPLPIPTKPVMTPQTMHEIRAQINLASELQQNELAFVKRQHQEEIAYLHRQHQKKIESSVRLLNAKDAEISELQEKMRELQKSTEEYAEIARNAINDRIILQTSISRKKSISDRAPTSTDERENTTKQVQFPSSKNPRPLSLTFRPATARRASPSPPRRERPPSFENTLSLRLPVTENFSSRPVTPDSSQVLLGNSIVSNASPKSADRRCRPGSACNSQKSSANPVSASIPSKTATRNNLSGPADNSSTSARRGLPQFVRHKLSNPFVRRQYRDDSTKAVSTVPVLPPFEASVPLNRQMADVLIDGGKRLTNDSGYDSLRSEFSSATSAPDT